MMQTSFMEPRAKYALLKNVHLLLTAPTAGGETFLTRESFFYFHYNCDGFNDVVGEMIPSLSLSYDYC